MKKIVCLELGYYVGDVLFAINLKKLDAFMVQVVNIEVSMKVFEETPNYTAPINAKKNDTEGFESSTLIDFAYFNKAEVTYVLCPIEVLGWSHKMTKALFKVNQSDADKLFFETRDEAINTLEKLLIDKGIEEKELNKRIMDVVLRYP